MTAERFEPVNYCFWREGVEKFDFLCPQCGSKCEQIHDDITIYFCSEDLNLVCIASQEVIGEPIHGDWDAYFTGTERLYYMIIKSETLEEAFYQIDLAVREYS
jgi:hypothetical protein